MMIMITTVTMLTPSPPQSAATTSNRIHQSPGLLIAWAFWWR